MRFHHALIAFLTCSLVLACGTKITVKGGPDAASSTADTSVVSTTGSGAAGTTSVSSSVGVGGAGAACEDLAFDPRHPMKPIDAIVAVENDFQMTATLAALEQHLYASFAAVLDQAGADSQIIVISDHGNASHELCIGPPLSSSSSCSGPPGNIPGQFRQFSTFVSWGSVLCDVLSSLDGAQADEFGVQSWHPWLRSTALKAFVMVSGSGSWCQYDGLDLFDQSSVTMGQEVALDWDAALLSSSPSQFGNSAARNYLVESIVGITPKSTFDPYYPEEPVLATGCNNLQPGTGLQWLSKGTSALRVPACDSTTVSSFLATLANDIVRSASDRCILHMPEPPEGEMWTFQGIDVIYTPSNSGPPQTWTRVDGPSQCGATNFYIEGNNVVLCPATCATVEADRYGDMELLLHCVETF